MTLPVALRLIGRESRGSRWRLLFFMACLAVGVTAVVAVAGLSASIDQGIRSEARKLLAADIAVEGRKPVPATIDELVAGVPGGLIAHVKEMATIVAAPGAGGAPGRSQLVELKAVEGGYPFYGELKLDPQRSLADLLDAEGAVVGPELVSALGLGIGDRVRIGGVDFAIRGIVRSEPDRLSVSFTLGPRVFLSMEGLGRSRLESFGSRIEHRALVKLAEGASARQVGEIASRIRETLSAAAGGTAFEVETFSEAHPTLRSALKKGERFLGLVALLSLLIGGIGVAQTVRAWLASRMDSIATLKCLGVRPRELFSLYVGQTVCLGAAGSLAGALAGTAVTLAVPRFLASVLPRVPIHPWQPAAVARGFVLGVGVSVLFSLGPLATLGRVPPLRVMRHDAEALPPSLTSRLATGVVLIAGVLATAWIQSGSLGLACGFTAGIAGVVGLLFLAAAALMWIVGTAPRRFAKIWMRHGLSALARPGAGTRGSIVALGLGVLVVVSMYIVQSRLAEQLRSELPSSAPTAFLVDIQPGQWQGVRSVLEKEGATNIDSVPIVTARLTRIDGRPVEKLAANAPDEGRRRWVLTREQNLTFFERLPEGNKVVEGSLWSDPSRPEISIESDFARDLGARIGSRLTFDVQGVPLDLVVTSLRTVDWKTFGINFFLIVEPGVLEEAPQRRVAAARLPAGREQAIQDLLASGYPNVTLLRIREILEKIVSILERVGLGVRVLGGFTVLAGVAILAGSISAGSVRRGREVALMKTIGMTRRGVASVFSVEYALIGLVSGVIGACGAGALAWSILTRWMEIEWKGRAGPFVAAVAGAVLISVAAGLASSLRALAKRPVEVLREE